MAYTTIDRPTDYFRTKLYNGNNNAQNITWDETDVNMKPDFLWIKSRAGSSVFDHVAGNVASGSGKYLKPNTTDVEVSNSNVINTFNTNGFSIGGATFVSEGGRTYVAWGWKGAGSTSSNTDGSITTNVSVNSTAGFSVVSYAGNDTVNATVGHGLGVKPDFIIFKARGWSGSRWHTYHSILGATAHMRLDSTAAFNSASSFMNNVEPTSSVINLGTSAHVNDTDIIAWCFHNVKGYSKFGSYEGNGNSDGTFVYTGFKPAFIITKRADTGGDNWHMLDSKRDIDNPAEQVLQPNESTAEATTSTSKIDFLSNGFKCRGTGSSINTSGLTYVYIAFAESPFVTSTGIPTTAR